MVLKTSFPAVFSTDRWYPATSVVLSGQRSLLGWLQDTGSLTARLVAHSQGQFEVQILSQRWGRAQLSEARALGIDGRARVLIREVVLRGRGQPWVFARSILPWKSLVGPLRRLRKLDSQPLGGWLFRQPGLKRQPLEVSSFPPGDRRLPAQWQTQRGQPALWGRRSVFAVAGKPLLVGEVFLPELLQTLG